MRFDYVLRTSDETHHITCQSISVLNMLGIIQFRTKTSVEMIYIKDLLYLATSEPKKKKEAA